MPFFRALLLLLTITCLGCQGFTQSGGSSSSASALPREFRALWVTRWDYRTPADIERICEQARELRATDLLFQVRGSGDAFYRSSLEPWGQELFRDLPPGTTDPGFDPLQVAIDAAHARNLRIHAWVNIMPLWKGKVEPLSPRHPFNLHPDWRLHDASGAPEPLGTHYVIANPALKPVQDHIVAVCADILNRYQVDGLHLDYIRFLSDESAPKFYPADPATLRQFASETGRTTFSTDEDKAALRAWLRDKITALVTRIRHESIPPGRNVELSAAVMRRPEIARDRFLQDAARWLNAGVVDRLLPMIYTEDQASFESDLDAWRALANGRPITPGIGAYMQRADQTVIQVAAADRHGYGLFAYSSFFDSVDPFQNDAPDELRARDLRLRTMRSLLERLAAVEP